MSYPRPLPLHDDWYHYWEQRLQMEIPRTARNSVIYALLILAFGVAVPAGKGLGFLDSTLLSAYACLGAVFAGPAAAQSFEKWTEASSADSPAPASLGQALKSIARAVLFGELLAIAMLAGGIATVFELNRAAFFPPDVESLGYSLLLGLAASLALASLAAWVTVEFSAGAARMALRLIFLGLLVLFYLRGRWLPEVVEPGILICLIAATTFLILLRRTLNNPDSGLTKP
jgi:hypothetical protein